MICKETTLPKVYLSKYGSVGENFQKARELIPLPALHNGHFNFWLPIRFLILLRFTAKDLLFKTAVNSYTNYLSLGAQNKHLADGVIRSCNIPPDTSCDFLFIRNQGGSDIIQYKDQFFSRTMEPYMKIAAAVGSTLRVEMVRSSFPIKQYIEKTIYVLHNKYRGEGFSKQLKNAKDLYKQICLQFPDAELTPEQIWFFIDEIFNLYLFFKEVLLRIRPKVVFSVAFYYFHPLHIACRELGIRSVDIQHCYMRGATLAYNCYDRAETSDVETLPTDFVTWSRDDLEHVHSLFPLCNALDFGYQWPNYCLDLFQEEQEYIKEKVKNIVNEKNYDRLVLIIISDVNIHPLLAAITQDLRARKNRIAFVLRAKSNFAMESSNSDDAKNMIKDDYINSAPLPIVLQCFDAVLTLQSSAIFEADAINIPSFVCAEEALSFRDLIEKKQLYHVTTVDEFYAKFDRVLSGASLHSSFTTNALVGAESFKAWLKSCL